MKTKTTIFTQNKSSFIIKLLRMAKFSKNPENINSRQINSQLSSIGFELLNANTVS